MSVLIYLEPLDTLFFRDHRPFIAGDDTIAEGGLPSPLTLYGAIGDYCLKKKNKSIEDFSNKKQDEKLGKYDPDLKKSNLKIKAVFLKSDYKVFLPVPLNLYKENNNYFSLLPYKTENNLIKWDIQNKINPIEIIITTHGIEPATGYISINSLKPYLTADYANLRPIIYSQFQLFNYEIRYSNKINKDLKTTEDLYWTKQLRFDEYITINDYIKTKIGIVIEGLNQPDFTDGDTLSIGGEQKRAKITLGDENILSSLKDDEIKTKIQETKKFFVY
ncbi:MAG: type III-B CRISPR module-associated Cmr3 family protein, partial [candidate division WOR-3 bacterium]|nr:type III-B CRISPR module-associated Cmr3 family protein [candidate division WOR-3 bacterium]